MPPHEPPTRATCGAGSAGAREVSVPTLGVGEGRGAIIGRLRGCAAVIGCGGGARLQGDGGEEGPEQRGEWRRRSPEQSRRCSPAGGLVGRLEAPPARPAGWPHRELRGLRAVAVERRRSGFSISTPKGSSGRTASIRGGDDGWRKFRTVARRGAAGRRIALLRPAATRARSPAPPPRARCGGDYRRGSLGAHPATRRSPRSRDTGPRRPPRSQPTSGWLWTPKA